MPRNRNRNKNRSKKKNRNYPHKRMSIKNKPKTPNRPKNKKTMPELEARNLNLVPRNINHPQQRINLNMEPQNNNKNVVFNDNQGKNVKRMVSSKMFSSKSKNGKEEVVVDILSGITKDKKSSVLRHFKVTKDGNTKYSTVLAKSNGEEIKVLESIHNGKQEKLKKFKVAKPDELKDVFSVQSEKIRGNNVIKTFNLNKKKMSKDVNKPSILPDKVKIQNKLKPKFNTMRRALQNSIKSIMKPRPYHKNRKGPNKSKKRRNRGKRGRK